jgi:CelD/BcsL family acetyltransferase involved in cellulose biosynthesis
VTVPVDNSSWFSIEISHGAPSDWADLLSRDPAAEYTHTRYWSDAVCESLPDADAVWLTARRSGDLIGGLTAVRRTSSRKVAGMPLGLRRLDSSFEGTSGGPVVAADLDAAEQDQVFAGLVDALAAQRPRVLGSCAMVLSAVTRERFGGLMSGRSAWIHQDTHTAVVSLSGGIDQVEKDKLVMNKRNERNRGLKRGAEVFVTDEAALFGEYYGIYDRASVHWGIDPVPECLLQALLRDGDGRVFFTCVRLEGKVIGGHLNLHYGDRVLAWNGVTDPSYAKTHFPATLCFWGDMVEACRRGAAFLDLGGSGSVGSLSGFKKYFGAELQARGLYVLDSPAAGLLRKGRDAWRVSRGTIAPSRWHDSGPGTGNGERS